MRRSAVLAFLLLLSLAAPRVAWAESTARGTVRAFYDAYKVLDRQGGRALDRFLPSQKGRLEFELFALLTEISTHDPRKGDEVWLDFDPYINAQMNAATLRLGKQSTAADAVLVPIYCSYRIPGHEQLATTVQVRRINGVWRITNFLYPPLDGAKAWDLKSWLKTQLKR